MKVVLQTWDLSISPLTLAADQVQVWHTWLHGSSSELQTLAQVLSPDEQERAARFRFPQHRDAFIAARGQLRSILSCYLNVKAQDLRFGYGPHGKPALVEPHSDLQFNLSHSNGLALFAISQGHRVGVDVEYIDSDRPWRNIAQRFFAPGENQVLSRLSETEGQQAFFHCWTRKEAFIKATGQGLSLPLDQFEVAIAPNQPAALLKTCWDEQEANRWLLQDLQIAPHYAAAVAVEESKDYCVTNSI